MGECVPTVRGSILHPRGNDLVALLFIGGVILMAVGGEVLIGASVATAAEAGGATGTVAVGCAESGGCEKLIDELGADTGALDTFVPAAAKSLPRTYEEAQAALDQQIWELEYGIGHEGVIVRLDPSQLPAPLRTIFQTAGAVYVGGTVVNAAFGYDREGDRPEIEVPALQQNPCGTMQYCVVPRP